LLSIVSPGFTFSVYSTGVGSLTVASENSIITLVLVSISDKISGTSSGGVTISFHKSLSLYKFYNTDKSVEPTISLKSVVISDFA
jgi:hypothetical protein